MSRTVRFIGLGVMGFPMAARLLAQGLRVQPVDHDAAVLARWRQAFGQSEALGPSEEPCDAVLICVTDEQASRAVFAQGLPAWRPGTLVIELGTTSARWAREADALARAAGLRYCDSPLSGAAVAAQRGELVAMLGAHADDVGEARALLAPLASHVEHLGPPGSGQLCKMANQLAIAGVAAGLAQAQHFARAHELDPARVFEVLSRGSADSVQLRRLRATLVDPANRAAQTFAWLAKDLDLCAAAGAAPLPLVTLWQTLWNDAR
jgi:3-hydroxyisobutyrate dehydrogenase